MQPFLIGIRWRRYPGKHSNKTWTFLKKFLFVRLEVLRDSCSKPDRDTKKIVFLIHRLQAISPKTFLRRAKVKKWLNRIKMRLTQKKSISLSWMTRRESSRKIFGSSITLLGWKNRKPEDRKDKKLRKEEPRENKAIRQEQMSLKQSRTQRSLIS